MAPGAKHASQELQRSKSIRRVDSEFVSTPGILRLIKRTFAQGEMDRNMKTIVLFTISNILMTLACYGHLKSRTSALWKVMVVS
jgi:hypothetical protein